MKTLSYLCTWLVALPLHTIAADDFTFDDGPTLGQRLLQNVVRIESRDLSEHGFGLVVGVDQRYVYVATARHVVSKRPPAGLQGTERISNDIQLGFCALPGTTALQSADMLNSFEGVNDDLALLRTVLPAGYTLQAKALATERNTVGDPAWQMGRENECGLAPTQGVIAALPDEQHNLRIDLHGVLGGTSGAPVVSGYGIVGITKRSNNETIRVHTIDDIQARVMAMADVPFILKSSRNTPPGDPQAAVIDLTETLNGYLYGVRDIHALLSQSVVPKQNFAQLVERYSKSVTRFQAASDKYDGTLKWEWSDDVLPQWSTLRAEIRKIHLIFFGLNGDAATTINRTERSPPEVQKKMAVLEPQLVALEADIARFTDNLGKRRINREKLSQ